jgi:hypothetical protein
VGWNTEGFALTPDRERLLAALRCARLRAELLMYEIDEIGVALKHDLISSVDAENWLIEIDAVGLLGFLSQSIEGRDR